MHHGSDDGSGSEEKNGRQTLGVAAASLSWRGEGRAVEIVAPGAVGEGDRGA